jgi:hypothetical protein
MSRDPRHGERSPADPACTRSRRVAELIERRLADARAHAERGRLADANARVLELRSRLVGRRPGDRRGDWLEAIQLSAQAIADLAVVAAAPSALARPDIRSAALAVWESRHRDRFIRWARRTLAERDPIESPHTEGSP